MNIAGLAIKRPVFVMMFVLSLLILGGMGYYNMGVDMLPDVEYPSLSVVTVYPGASAEEIENLVTKPLEEGLATSEGLDTLSSTSGENVSEIVVRFGLGVDVKYAETKVRDAVNKTKWKLPDGAEDPSVVRFSAADYVPLIIMVVKGKKDLATLKEIVEDKVKPQIEKIKGVGRVDLWGGRDRAVKVTIKKSALAARAVSAQQVAEAIGKENLNYPAGIVKQSLRQTNVRVQGKVESLEELKNISIKNYAGGVMRVRDLADVSMGLKTETRRTRVDGENAILFSVYKLSGENTVNVAHAVKKKVKEISKSLPADTEFRVFRDPSIQIENSIKGLQEDILLGALAAIFIVYLFLGSFRSTFITAIALPNSLIGAFFFISYAGFTINMLVLLALSLSIGLLIDDSIVVRENIFRYIEKGMKPKEAAEKGTNEVGMAVVATTLSIMAVFIPISFLNGVVGQFFKEFGVTVAFALAISLVDAFTTAPMLSAYWYKKEEPKTSGLGFYAHKMTEKWNAVYEKIKIGYHELLIWALAKKKTVLIGVSAMLLISIGAAVFIGMSFLPDSDYHEFEMTIETYPGASIDVIDEKLIQIEKYLKTVPEIESYYTVAGWEAINRGRIFCSLLKKGRKTGEVTDVVYNYINENYGKEIIVSREDNGAGAVVSGGGDSFPITINITGPDMKELENLARQIKKITQETAGVSDTNSTYRPGLPEVLIKMDRVKAAKLGVSTYETGMLLNTLITGKEISRLRKGEKEYAIILELNDADKKDISALRDIMLTNNKGEKVPLSAVAKITYGSGPVQIKRENKKRIIKVTGSIKEGFALGDVVKKVGENIKANVTVPDGYEYAFGGQATQMKETLTQMGLAMLLAMVFMYMILASLYNSLIQPLILMTSVPLAIIGAFLALLLTGQKMDIMAMIGLLMVLGLVAKNGILLIDFTNQKRREGMSAREALLHAGPIRLRPILMTTFAMICGMLPLAIGLGEEGALRTKAMPIAVIGGLLTSTFLTLVVIPVVYEMVENALEKKLIGQEKPGTRAKRQKSGKKA